MKFTLIVCTYMRSKALVNLLLSVSQQTLYPDEILVIDASTNSETKNSLKQNKFNNLKYYKVDDANRGLTKQRNYGINLVSKSSEIVCFLDDDIVLTTNYFKNLLKTYSDYPKALAVGGYISNEVNWKQGEKTNNRSQFYFDGWLRNEPSRFQLRRKFGLHPDTPPAFLPSFAHGRSVGFLPPSGKIYKVEQIMGGVSSYKKEIFKTIKFSTYFEGYGLYEDTDFSLRIAKQGSLYVNTNAQLSHFHDNSGRPNKYKYGKMVVRNGWYVWRVKYDNPSFKSRIKWNLTVWLLTTVRFTNIFTTKQRKEAFTETLGRVVGWLSLLFNSPKYNS
ncbi:MAG: glycosyltransferase family 2 protein [Algibacter sp.]|uniref:glycosyltransferase family 2 protein n=1 Tax=Algibacter sp. TaxID=1872428 RepID=UPI0032999D23